MLLLLLLTKHPFPFPDSILELLKENLHHYLCIEFDEGLNDTVVYIIGFKFFAMFAMFVIVSLACNLRTKRNRGKRLHVPWYRVFYSLVGGWI